MQAGLKKTSRVSLVALLILLAGAFVFYKERVLFSDTAFIAFNIINYNTLSIQEHRYGSFITQMAPYIGQRFHLPLKTILIGYSVSFNLFYFLVAALLVYRFKQYGLAILMALYYFLFVSDSYFWINNEIHQAVAWMFLFLGATLHMGYKKARIAWLLLPFLLLAFLTISAHFIVIIPTIFLWVYLMIQRDKWPFSKKVTILLSSLLLAIIVIKYLTTMGRQSYDSYQLRGLSRLSIKDIINSFTTPVVKIFSSRCVENYWLSILVFVTGIVALVKSKQRMLTAWTVISCFGYFILMGLIYAELDSGTLLFHIETEWQCLGIIIAAPFVFTFLPKLNESAAGWLLAGVFIIRLLYIISFLPSYTLRNNMKEQLLSGMRKKGITKLALFSDQHLTSVARLSWALPYETMMASAMEGDKPQLTFFFLNPDDKQTPEKLKNPKDFYDGWYMTPSGSLNKEYFSIDSTKPYQVETYQEFLK